MAVDRIRSGYCRLDSMYDSNSLHLGSESMTQRYAHASLLSPSTMTGHVYCMVMLIESDRPSSPYLPQIPGLRRP